MSPVKFAEEALKEGYCNKASLECFELEFASSAFVVVGIALGSYKEACWEDSSYKHNLGFVVVEDVIVIVVAFGFGLLCYIID